ncbi:hypothetical protein ACFFJT_01920 [Dyella flava]|uniref:DOT1 domain-containing protein n=1 Tax=Dyella flava TaxID=1920170 RepID=A0ABS2K5T6_9GAMM|nr:class I SAM-dependent methyltransferase [Dyella flava]MBM7126244.1 hypothetical protein [Dyella flava]GLQ48951.1 hypothetical protein GCM10010872_04000 [Dyella flava]
MNSSTMQRLLDACERDRSLHEPARLRQRIEMLDRLDDALLDAHDRAEDGQVRCRAKAIYDGLDAINRRIYQQIRREIQQGRGADELLKWASGGSASCDQQSGQGYDYLDALLSGVLAFEAPAEGIAALAPEMVFYQPTPARHIFDAVRRLSLSGSDVLMDLGSGLGHVPLLAAICAKAYCVGIELETAYVACARQCAQALNLANASFIHQDVRSADFSSGTVFYLYTPFIGMMLRSVLQRLAKEVAQRPIRLCTLGPCTSVVANETWLTPIGSVHVDRISVFSSNYAA